MFCNVLLGDARISSSGRQKVLNDAFHFSLTGRVPPHMLRYTCATWLMQAGVDKWEAADFLGMSVEMLDRVYGHHHPDHMKAAARAIGYRPRQSLAITLAVERSRGGTTSQVFDKSGGRDSHDRTSLHGNFPANREFYREFRNFPGPSPSETLNNPV